MADARTYRAVLVTLGLLVRPLAALAGPDHASSDHPRSLRVMRAIEESQRAGDRMFSMDVELVVGGRFREHRRILAISRHEARETRLLYVMTEPRIYRGTTLAIRDAGGSAHDGMWFGFAREPRVHAVHAESMSLLVPGTGLTFEDARGWIATEKYRFDAARRDGRDLTIVAWPRSEALGLGISRLELRVDPVRRVVLEFTAHDAAGNVTRRYRARNFTSISGRWYPARVVVEHPGQRLEATLSFDYAPVAARSERDRFESDSSAASAIKTLAALRDRAGLRARFPDTLRVR